MDPTPQNLKRKKTTKPGRIMAIIEPLSELMRLHKPVGILNIFFPYMYGLFYITLVTDPTPPMVQTLLLRLPLLFFNTFILRSVGCAWNDIVDMDIDKLVERTRIRPLPRGAISLGAAYALSLGLFAAWIATLTYLLPDPSRLFVYAVPLTGMVVAYPYMKRITSYAQVWLGLTLAWGVLFGGAIAGFDILAHVEQTLSDSETPNEALIDILSNSRVCGLVALYLVYVTWSVIHDTIYAFQDYKDDKLAGVKSMALQLSGSTKSVLWTLSEVQVLLLVAACLTMVPTGSEPRSSQGIFELALALILRALHRRWIFLVTAALGNGIVLSLMVGKVDLSDPQDCARWFKIGSIWVGSCIGLGFFLEYIFQAAL